MALRRLVIAVVVVAVSGLAYLGRERSVPEDLGVGAAPAPATALACPVEVDRSGGGRVAVASTRSGEIPVTAFAAGFEAGVGAVDVDTAGGGVAPSGRFIAGGLAAALVELPDAESTASILRLTSSGTAAAPCTRPILDVAMIPGASTRSEEATRLQLLNPYAVDAVVSVTSASEAGIDSARELAEVIVPARSVITRDLSTLLPLRTSLTLRIRVERGAVHAFVEQSGEGDRMLLPAVEAATEWWVPVVDVEAPAVLEVATSMPAPVEVEVTAYGSGGVVGTTPLTVPAEGLAEVQVAQLGEAITGVSVAATAPVVTTLTAEGAEIRAGTPGVAELASRWLLPGPGVTRDGSLWVFNPGEVEVEVTTQPLFEGAGLQRELIPPGGRVRIPADPAGTGFLVQASGEVAVVATIEDAVGVALIAGAPVETTAAGEEDRE